MKHLSLAFLLLGAPIFALTAQEKEEAKIQALIEKPFNPLSLILPNQKVLSRMSVLRVMDMGATSYANGFLFKALYFYTNVIALFPQDTESVAWSHYEAAFIYTKLWNKTKALQHLDILLAMAAPDPVALKLAQNLSSKLRDPKEYKVYRKQEDVLFVQEKHRKRTEDRQIAKEEEELRKIQAAQKKERKRLEKEEKARRKAAQKAAA